MKKDSKDSIRATMIHASLAMLSESMRLHSKMSHDQFLDVLALMFSITWVMEPEGSEAGYLDSDWQSLEGETGCADRARAILRSLGIEMPA